MIINFAKQSPKELREEIHLNLIDLFGDVLLLDRLLFSSFDEDDLAPYCAMEILDTLYRRLQDHIDSNAGELIQLTRILLDGYFLS